MAIREKFCELCKCYFLYDDGMDDDGVGRLNKTVDTPNHEWRKGYCPNCIDPHYIPGESYSKTEVLEAFRRHLEDHDIITAYLDDLALSEMLKEFPTAYAVYTSNGTYLTFNLHPGTIFDSEKGKFEITGMIQKSSGYRIAYFRDIKCCRCGRSTRYARDTTLDFYLGFQTKKCFDCDPHKRNTNGLNRNGRTPSPISQRAVARSLNISRSEYRSLVSRGEKIQRREPLKAGSIINGLEIIEAYWDDAHASYAPKYKLECTKCGMLMVCLQKQINEIAHFCKGKVHGNA